MRSNRFKYDAFVSHAVEDKIAVANELCARLERAGLRLWYSGEKLKVGDSLEKSIDTALDQSRYGIVILSPTYLGRSWPRKEYYMLKAKEATNGKVILPVLFDITMEELQKSDIHIADRWALPIDDKKMDVVVQKLLEEIKPGITPPEQKLAKATQFLKSKAGIGSILATLLVIGYFIYSSVLAGKPVPPLEYVQQTIQDRVALEETKIKQKHDRLLADLAAVPSNKNEVTNYFNQFSNIKSNYRNEYELRYPQKTIRARKNVEKELNINVQSFNPQNEYNLQSPNIFLAARVNGKQTAEARYLLFNTQPVTPKIIDEDHLENGDYVVTVAYQNYIREFFVTLLFPSQESNLKRHQMIIIGLPERERFTFQQASTGWILNKVD